MRFLVNMKLLGFPHLKLLCLFSLEKESSFAGHSKKHNLILHNARYWITFRLTSSGDFNSELENITHLNVSLNSFCKNSSSWCEVLVTWIYFFLPRIVDFTTNQSQTSPGFRMSRNTFSLGRQLTDSLIFYKQKLSSLNSGFNPSFQKCIRQKSVRCNAQHVPVSPAGTGSLLCHSEALPLP